MYKRFQESSFDVGQSHLLITIEGNDQTIIIITTLILPALWPSYLSTRYRVLLKLSRSILFCEHTDSVCVCPGSLPGREGLKWGECIISSC